MLLNMLLAVAAAALLLISALALTLGRLVGAARLFLGQRVRGCIRRRGGSITLDTSPAIAGRTRYRTLCRNGDYPSRPSIPVLRPVFR